MSTTITGHCLCGAVSYTSDAEPVATAICHCDDCQRQSGAPFSLNVLIAEDQLVLTGELKTFQTIGTESGATRDRCFCPECGSPIFTRLTDMPGLIALKAGTLDDRSWLAPQMEVWCDRRHSWVQDSAERGEFARGLPS